MRRVLSSVRDEFYCFHREISCRDGIIVRALANKKRQEDAFGINSTVPLSLSLSLSLCLYIHAETYISVARCSSM
jgi:hypothetical protein